MRRDARAHVAPSTAARHPSAALATMPRCSRGSRGLPAGARYRRYSTSTYLACRRPASLPSPPPTHRIFTTQARCRRPDSRYRARKFREAHASISWGREQQPETSGAPRSGAAAGAARTRARLGGFSKPVTSVSSCCGQASNPILALRGEGKNEDAKSRPGRDGLLRFLSGASCGLGRLRLGRVKYSPRRLREDAVRRVSTPERLHCVDHPTLVGDPVGLRSAGTWREASRSFSRNVACRRRGL